MPNELILLVVKHWNHAARQDLAREMPPEKLPFQPHTEMAH